MIGHDDSNSAQEGFEDDIDGAAAEYVLGTLSYPERMQVEARCRREPLLREAVERWQQRLAPLAEIVPDVTPSPQVWPGIKNLIREGGRFKSLPSNVITLNRRITFWRSATLVTSAIAASLAMFVGVSLFAPKPPTKPLVAVLQKDAASPAFLVTVDVDKKQMTVRPVSAPHTPGKSYELWLVHDALGGPQSLGVLSEVAAVKSPLLAVYKPDVIETATYAVSLEPEGGSTTGLPTGPVVFSGKLIESGL